MGTISKNFSFREFEASDTAKRRGICNVITDTAVRDHIVELTRELLQPLRDEWGSSLTITSGYRCKLLNDAVGGSTTSAHVTGYAADIVPANGKISEFIAFAIDWAQRTGAGFDQIIDEKDKKGAHWCHIGMYNSRGQQRRQVKKMTKK